MEAMTKWKVELRVEGKTLAEVKIKRGDVLSQLLIIISMMPLNYRLKKCTGGYRFTKSQEGINHLMYMDDIKLFAKMKEISRLIQAIIKYNQDIRMEFGIEKYAILIIKSEKREITEGIELPDKERTRTLGEKENIWKYWKQTQSSKRR